MLVTLNKCEEEYTSINAAFELFSRPHNVITTVHNTEYQLNSILILNTSNKVRLL